MIVKENTKEQVSNSQDVAKVLQSILSTETEIDQEKEHFWVFGLNTKNVIGFIDLASLGTLTNALVHPREVFRLAISRGVNSIIVGHNHPSGDPAPSKDDIFLTEKLKNVGEILDIKLLDHVVIGNNTGNFLSMSEKGYL